MTSIGTNRLYTRFISVLKIIQYVGYFLVVAGFSLFWISALSSLPGGTTVPPTYIVIAILQVAILCGVIYIVTQGLIAIVDLLSRIEKNTRLDRESSEQE